MKKYLPFFFLVLGVMIFNVFKPAIVKQIVDTRTSEFNVEIDSIVVDGHRRGLSQIRERLPYRVDERTVLIDAFVDGRKLIYFFRIDAPANDFLPNSSELQRNSMIESVCSSTDMRKMLSIGAVYAYRYISSDNREISAFEIDHRDCKWK
jgi:hypothetical protein